jgi:putative aldouronate transport system substrate-binding protein
VRKTWKTASLMIAILILLSSVAACTTTAAPTAASSASAAATTAPAGETAAATVAPTTAPTPSIDISKEVEIKYVHIGGATPFEDQVLAALNNKLKAKINATFSVQYLGWGDAWTKAPLMFASGEDFDFIFCAPWFLFNDEAKKGAYLPLNDLLPQYAPDLYKDCPTEAWNQSSIDGKIMMIPAFLQKNMVFWGMSYREDLRQKYNVPEIKKVTDLEAYFSAIKKNEKNMAPFAVDANEAGSLQLMYIMENSNYQIEGLDATLPFAYDLNDPTAQLKALPFDTLEDQWDQIAKKWADAGYWSKNALANQTPSADALVAGASSICGWNSSSYSSAYTNIKQKNQDANLGFYLCLSKDGKAARRQYNANGVALNANSKNPERTLMFLNLLVTDQDIYQTATYGIDGTTYTKSPEGYFETMSKLKPEEQWGFGHMFGMGFSNYKFDSDDTAKLPADYVEKYNNPTWQEPLLVTPALTGIVFDTDPVKSELAAVTEVDNTYGNVLALGLVPDPAATLAEYRQKLKDAGIDKVQAELQKQIDTFLAAKKK